MTVATTITANTATTAATSCEASRVRSFTQTNKNNNDFKSDVLQLIHSIKKPKNDIGFSFWVSSFAPIHLWREKKFWRENFEAWDSEEALHSKSLSSVSFISFLS